jgi:hypothetical protein
MVLWLAPLILSPLAILWTFWLDHPRWPLLSYDDIFALGRLGLRWPNQDLLPIELDHVHVHRERVLVELYLGTFYKFQLSFIYGRLNLSMEKIAIISTMRIRIMPFAISMLFELFRRWYDMITWQFNLFLLQQVIKNPITLSDVESVAHLVLSAFRSRLLAVIKCIYLPPTYLYFMQDIEDRCLLLTSSMSFVDLPFQEHRTKEKHRMDQNPCISSICPE